MVNTFISNISIFSQIIYHRYPNNIFVKLLDKKLIMNKKNQKIIIKNKNKTQYIQNKK